MNIFEREYEDYVKKQKAIPPPSTLTGIHPKGERINEKKGCIINL